MSAALGSVAAVPPVPSPPVISEPAGGEVRLEGRDDGAARPRVARVVVDVPLAHLDRPFDYAVPDKFADTVQPGCRVRVRFSGQLLDGFVVSLDDASEFPGRLSPLSHVPSGEPVLTPQVARLARVVADRYAGTLSDVLRLALPPRRGAPEKRPTPTPDA
jgi:primosomal protein N' (replication factor Y)